MKKGIPSDGDFVLVEYTGKALGKGAVFDTTDREEAKTHGIFDEKAAYGPKLIVIGRGQVIRGLEDELRSMGEGEERVVRLQPEKAFGARDRGLLRVMPLMEFVKGGITPVLGMAVLLDGRKAVVKSVTSGRVMVDFNHPMAGEEVEYRVRLKEVIRDGEGKVKALMKANGVSGSVKMEAGTIKVALGGEDKERIGNFLKGATELMPELNVRVVGEQREKKGKNL
jgi:FKBP-type peptidyl-prolyl cis-trans isomerase 2